MYVDNTSADSPLDRVLDRLENVRRENGGFKALCPAHNDKKPSLGIAVGDDGRVLLKCYAGCPGDDVRSALELEWRDLYPENGNGLGNGHRKVVETYDYTDEAGKLLFQSVRYEPKGFGQRKPDGAGGWISQGVFKNGTQPVLYKLPKVLEAVREGKPIFAGEGEKDVHRLEREGLVATTNPMGAGKWRDRFSETLAGADVRIVPDNDQAGHDHARKVAKSLQDKAASVRIVELPGVPEGGDVSDWFAAGGTADELLKLAAQASEYEPEPNPQNSNGKVNGDNATPKKRAQADRLVDYVLESEVERFMDQTGRAHALAEGEAVSLDAGCYCLLRNIMWAKENIAVGGDALKTASGMLAALTVNEGKVRELHTRAAFHEGAVYYQLGHGRVVKINRDNWRMVDNPPVVFRSVRNLKPLPEPERGGSLDAVEKWANLKTDRDKRLFRAYLITVALAHLARPILQITGTQGSGKTTLNRLVKRLLDPTAPETVRADPRDFLQKASHAFIVVLDNLNSLPEWAVDTICRLVTGEGDSKRILYSDDEDFVYELKRAILLNGINSPADRGDAQDRTLPVELERITNRKRRGDAEIWAEFDALHPKLLGAVFDALSRALKVKEGLKLVERPRLADWGEHAAAVYEAEGWSEDGKEGADLFLEDWGSVVKVQNQAALDGSSVAQAVIAFMEGRDQYTGKASELHAALEGVAESLKIDVKRDKTWPKSPSWLWRRMKEVLPVIMAAGVDASSTGNGKTGTFITLRQSPGDPEGDPNGTDPEKEGRGGSKGGSSEGSSHPTATPRNSDTYAESGSSGSKVAFPGHIRSSLSRTEEDKEAESGQTGHDNIQSSKDSRNATSGTSATTTEQTPLSSASQQLSAEEVAQVQRLMADGWSVAAARAEVLAEEML